MEGHQEQGFVSVLSSLPAIPRLKPQHSTKTQVAVVNSGLCGYSSARNTKISIPGCSSAGFIPDTGVNP